MAYIYCHFKEDSGDPFYVGMGKTLRRPWNKSNRSEFHKNVVKKHGIRVSVIVNSISWESAMWWEMRWIKALRDAGYVLANHTDGGDGTRGLPAHNRMRVTCLETGEHFDSATEAAIAKGLSAITVSDVCRGKYASAGGFHFVYGLAPEDELLRNKMIRKLDMDAANARKKVINNKNHMEPINGRDCTGRKASGPLSLARRVLCVTDGNIFDSASSAARNYNVSKSALIELCLGKNGRKSVGGFVFQYIGGK